MRHVLLPLFTLLALAACTGAGTGTIAASDPPATRSAPVEGSFTKAMLLEIPGPDNVHP